jgi:hypothetical protein
MVPKYARFLDRYEIGGFNPLATTKEDSIPGWGPIRLDLKVGDRIRHGYRDTMGTVAKITRGVGRAALGKTQDIRGQGEWPVDYADVEWDRGTQPKQITAAGEGSEWYRLDKERKAIKPWDLTPEQRYTLASLGKHEILDVDDDGNLTLSSGDTKYVLTTDGNIYVHRTTGEAPKKILGMSYITVSEPGNTSFNKGEVVSPEAFEEENKRMRQMGLKEATGWSGEEGEWPHGGNGGGEGSIEMLAAVKHRVRDRVKLGDLQIDDKFWSYNSDVEYVVTEPPREYPGWGMMAHYKEVGTGKPMRASSAAWVFRYPPHEWGRDAKIPHKAENINYCEEARGALAKYEGDVEAGHTEAAQYWKGQAEVYGLLCSQGAEARLQYLSDSPEYLAQTVESSGWRGQLDKEFNKAIARARGVNEQATVSS